MKFVHNEEYRLPRYVRYYFVAILATVVLFATAGCSNELSVRAASATGSTVDESVVVTSEQSDRRGPRPTGDYDAYRGPNYTDRVVLTYDDCPKSRQQLLVTVRAAKQYDMGLVLAPTGNCLEEMGADIAEIMREHGQYVINHSVSHPAFSSLSTKGVVRELGAPGVVTNYGRPPYGDGYGETLVMNGYESVGMKPWLWTVDTNDWQGKSASAVVSYVVANADKGDTVLLHMNHLAFNPESIMAIQRGLAARRLEVCRAYKGVTPVMLPDSLPC